MESRKIIVKSSEFNGTKTIMSAATTLAELKNDLDNAGISYRGMQFLEGISNTELKNDNSVLPHDVPYKGRVTNELVFWLTKSEKNIASGAMSRQECYAYLKENNLGEDIKAKYGRNYTQVPTDDLNNFIDSLGGEKEEPKKAEPKKPAKESKPKKADTNKNIIADKFKKFIEYIEDEIFDTDDLYEDDAYFTMKRELNTLLLIDEEEVKKDAPYSDKEIEDMFKDMM